MEIEDEDLSTIHMDSGRPNSRVAVASVALNKALGATGRRLLKRWTGVAAIIKVPSDQWIVPIRSAVTAINPKAYFAEETAKPTARPDKETGVAVQLAMGGLVVGISSDPEKRLPAVLRSVATHQYEITPITPEIVTEAMGLCLSGRAPVKLRRMDFSQLDFDVLCACMPQGGSKADATARIAQAVAAIQSPPDKLASSLDYPKLEDAVEYGEARTWGLELKADLEDLRSGKMSWAQMDRGAVLEGPPGSGKTTFVRILGKACDLPVVASSVAELFAQSDGHLDGVIKAQRELFARAIEAAPSILFVDELNSLPDPATIAPRAKDWWLPVVHDFYLLLDSAMSSREGVVVIGATNLIGDISPALLRPGRLERSLHIGIPGVEGLANILRTHLGKDLVGEDLSSAAQAGLGATAAIAMEWVRGARRVARRADRAITVEDLLAQIIPTETRTDDERYRVAVHEAGHATIGVLLGQELSKVSIVQRGASGGSTLFEPRVRTLFDRDLLERKATMMLAGRAAEVEIFGSASSGAGGDHGSDLATATRAIASLRSSYGLGDTLVWASIESSAGLLRHDSGFRNVVEQDLQRLYSKALEMVKQHRPEILALADALLKENVLRADRVGELLRSGGQAINANSEDPFIHIVSRANK